MRAALSISAFLTSFAGLSVPAYAEWPAQSISIGMRDHPKIMARFGGAITDRDLSEYVDAIGRDIVRFSSRSDENWTFTVLDSPEVNAFALPGGYIYVTRGLLALANNEAELAAVLAHEITHVIEEHVEHRDAANKDALIDGALGALAQGIFGRGSMGDAIRDNIESALGEIGANSQEQEYAADRGGILLLAQAGYDPYAQADFLASMAANSALRAEMAGRGYDPEKVPFFANHPAPVERELIARDLAGGMSGDQNVDAYFAAIDGLLFGDSTQQGFVRGQVFSHPVLGFTFTAADGLNIQNTARQINIIGAHGSTLVMTGARDSGGSLTRYLTGWAESIPRRERIGQRITNTRNFTINGMEAATGTIRMRRNARRGDLQMTVIRFDGQLIRFAGFSRDRDDDAHDALTETVRSFDVLDRRAMAALNAYQVEIHKVTGRDSVARLGATFPQQDFGEKLFRVLNGMDNDDRLQRGSLVKIIVIAPQ